jgi:uncharacterized protein YggE
MPIRPLTALLLLLPAISFGQAGAGTITVMASNSSNPQPDQAIFNVSVASGASQGLDTIVAALGGTGISAASLSGLSLNTILSLTPGVSTQLSWTFQLIVPVAQIQSTTAALLALEKTTPQNNSGLTLSFNVQGTQVSQQLQGTCDFVGLMNNARAQAQNLAAPTGFTTGAVVGIAGSISQSTPGCSMTVTFGLPVSRTGPNTITISASRTASSPPDQVSIFLDVTSDQTAGLDDINAALAEAGITGASFTGVSTSFATGSSPCSPCGQSALEWYFTLTTPLGKLTPTLAQLAKAQQSLTQQNSAWSFSFSLQSLGTSQPSQPACDEAGLASDARSQAQTLAAAAGAGVGAILNLSDQPISFGLVPAYRAGDFAISAVGTLNLLQATVAPSTACSLSVQFQLL